MDSSDTNDSDGMLLYTKPQEETEEESESFWDDAALIKAYDKAVNIAYDAVNKPKQPPQKKSTKSKAKSSNPNDFTFKVPESPSSATTSQKICKLNKGEMVEAPYGEDGEIEYYRARVVECGPLITTVIFEGYGDEIHSISTSSIHKLNESATNMPSECPPIPILPPPPTLKFMHGGSMPSNNEALSSMLMSWYMSGYHTGYYQAMVDSGAKK